MARARASAKRAEEEKGCRLHRSKASLPETERADLCDRWSGWWGHRVSLISRCKTRDASSHKTANLWPWVGATGMEFFQHRQIMKVETTEAHYGLRPLMTTTSPPPELARPGTRCVLASAPCRRLRPEKISSLVTKPSSQNTEKTPRLVSREWDPWQSLSLQTPVWRESLSSPAHEASWNETSLREPMPVCPYGISLRQTTQKTDIEKKTISRRNKENPSTGHKNMASQIFLTANLNFQVRQWIHTTSNFYQTLQTATGNFKFCQASQKTMVHGVGGPRLVTRLLLGVFPSTAKEIMLRFFKICSSQFLRKQARRPKSVFLKVALFQLYFLCLAQPASGSCGL